MADENQEAALAPLSEKKCEECVPGLPSWMATFSDMMTLLLTFFVLLLSFAKTETAKYEAALGSIRNAFGGNVFKQGKVIQRGKSADNARSMLESESPIKPFPIDFLTTEGLLDKKEVNRESEEDLVRMRADLKAYGLSDGVTIYEMTEGIKVRVKDRIYFKASSLELLDDGIKIPIYESLLKMIKNRNWILIIEGHAGRGETFRDEKGVEHDAFSLSALRSQSVARSLMSRGVPPDRITTVFYGDSRPQKVTGQENVDEVRNRRVEFIIRKRDLGAPGRKVQSK